jgi:hypothetical protein
MPTDDELLEQTLAFSGAYVSDDGNVTIRRFGVAAFEYSGDRFLGHCAACSRAGVVPSTGESLPDVAAAVRFLSTHDHADAD